MSDIAAQSEQTRSQVLAEVRSLIAATPELAKKDEVSVPYTTRTF